LLDATLVRYTPGDYEQALAELTARDRRETEKLLRPQHVMNAVLGQREQQVHHRERVQDVRVYEHLGHRT
jgi:hypothetical protein